MKLSRPTLLICLTVLFSLSSQLASADTKSELAAALKGTQIKLENKQSALVTLESRLQSYSDRLVDAQEKLDKANAEQVDAKAELSNAKAATGDNVAVQQDLASKKVELANNALESRKKRLESTHEKLDSLNAELRVTQQDIQSLKVKEATLTTQLNSAINSVKQQAQRPTMPTGTPSVATPVTATIKPIATPKIVEPVAPEPQAVETIASEEAKVQTKPATPPTEQELYAQQEMRALNDKVRGADTEGYRQYTELHVEINNSQREELEFLGNSQYYGEVILDSGKQKLDIRNRTFKIDIPKDQNSDTFIIIYDASNRQKSRFVIFNKGLLNS